MKKKLIWAAIAIIATMAVFAAAPKAVEWRIKEEAKKRGFTISIRKTGLSWGQVDLEGVTASPTGQQDQSVDIQRVRIKFGGRLNLEEVSVEGGTAQMHGSVEEIKSSWAGGGGDSHAGTKARFKKKISNLTIVWTKRAGKGLDATATGVAWDGTSVTAESMETSLRGWRVKVHRASISSKSPVRILAERIELERTESKLETVNSSSDNQTPDPVWPEVDMEILEAAVKYGTRKMTAFGVKSHVKVQDGKTAISASIEHAELQGKARISDVKIEVMGSSQSLEGKIRAASMETSNPALADSEMRTGAIEISGTASREGERKTVEGKISINKTSVAVEAVIRPEALSLRLKMPPTQCQDLLDSVPPALMRAVLPGTKMGGIAAWEIHLDVDLPKTENPDARLKLENGCKVTSVPDGMRLARLMKPFKRKMVGYDGKEREIISGPGSGEWVPIHLVSRFVPVAFQTMEDPGFMAHRGFHIEAIENSIEINLREKRFARGASTITMQLAKNLWLGREKTAARKLQEAVLTTYLEQALSKERILELYLNVVEFGPGVYGIRSASRTYFRTDPLQLTLAQSLLLASVLPKPDGAYFGPNGVVSPGRMGFLRRTMKAMFDTLRVSKDEYEDGIREVLKLGNPDSSGPEESEIGTSEGGLSPSGWEAD